MLLEKIRAEYLVTEPSDYSLRLMVVPKLELLEDTGKNLVIAALVKQSLHIRIFDSKGRKVVDKAKTGLVDGKSLTNIENRFAMTINDVLQAGGWSLPDELSTMSVTQKRELLIEKLGQMSAQPATYYKELTDDRLIGSGAVLAFLLKQGIRTEAGLKTYK
jgi:hypothetical protein